MSQAIRVPGPATSGRPTSSPAIHTHTFSTKSIIYLLLSSLWEKEVPSHLLHVNTGVHNLHFTCVLITNCPL